VPEPSRTIRRYEPIRDGLLAEAAEQGLAGEARFNWLVDQALLLFTHTVAGHGDSAAGGPRLRPEFERLFTKFRIGKTMYTYKDPATGNEVTARVARCGDCHAPAADAVSGAPAGLKTGEELLSRMRELTALTARAERLLLAARRGGVATRPALQDIDDAVNAQIELEVLVHTFSTQAGSPFMAKHEEGLKHAQAALIAGREALRELGFRRAGLYVALVIILLVLVGLGLKIRTLSATAGGDEADKHQGGTR
jgi:hypothetical protein